MSSYYDTFALKVLLNAPKMHIRFSKTYLRDVESPFSLIQRIQRYTKLLFNLTYTDRYLSFFVMYKALSRSLKMGGSSYSELCYVVKICWGSVWRGLIDAWKSSCSPQSICVRKKDRIRLPNCGSCVLFQYYFSK